MDSITFARQYLNQEIDLDAIDMDADQREHHRESIRKGKETLAEFDKVEEHTAKLLVLREKTGQALIGLEKALPEMILRFGRGEVKHSKIVEHRSKIYEAKTLLLDLHSAISLLTGSVSQRPVTHAIHAMDQVRYLQEKQAEKKAKKAKG